VTLTDEAYLIQIDLLLKAREAAAYEPMQLRVLALQARANLLQARNSYIAAWKQFAATLNQPHLPPTQLAGRADMPVPCYSYDALPATVLARHTDVATANNGVLRARYNLRLAEVTPLPDMFVRGVVQKDFTAPPFNAQFTVQVAMQSVPLFDRNRGAILQAQ